MIDRKPLQELRPEISTISEQADSSLAELFQNQCLRPILKFQHDLLLALFRQYIVKRKNAFDQLTTPGQQLQYIDQSIRQDLKFKNLLIGTIVGQFTLEEYQQYVASEKELSRRLTDLLVQRLQNGVISV